MYRVRLGSTARALGSFRTVSQARGARTFLTSTSAPRRTWRGAAVRWGLAITAVYWYNTSPIFADELAPQTVPEPPQFSDSDLSTVDAIIDEKRRGRIPAAAPQSKPNSNPAPSQQTAPMLAPAEAGEAEIGSPEELEEEAGQQGAFNPETGEINWDCPCLGGMANGPCGEDFKAAFSCFVYSKEEPKGMDCIEKFQHMQDCFRKYPDIYGSELQDDEDEEGDSDLAETESAATARTTPQSSTQDSSVDPMPHSSKTAAEEGTSAGRLKADTTDGRFKDPIPPKAVDATDTNHREQK